MSPKPHFFLIEDDLGEIEQWRKMAGSARQSLRDKIGHLAPKLHPRDALILETILTDYDVTHRLFVAALDARTAELTDEALGYQRPD